jgi:uncharacterized FlaG/YvyC family protein
LKGLNEKHYKTEQDIHNAFKDLNELMNRANEMVKLASSLSKQSGSNFTSIIDQLGIQNPVTRQVIH